MSRIPEQILQSGCSAYCEKFLNGLGSLGDRIEAAYFAIHDHDDWVHAGPKAWDGEGLPPAGTVCEVKGCMSHYLKWNKVTVFAVRGKTVLFDMEDGRWGQTESHEFRKIRTPEQIAAEEREAALTDIALLMGKDPERPRIREMAAILYDAGYRKQVAP
jgi:hypothetical protein